MPTDEILSSSLEILNSELNKKSAAQRIIWLYSHFESKTITLTTSGGETSALIPYLTKLALEKLQTPQPPIIFIDTGYYASSTLSMAKSLSKMGYRLIKYQPLLSPQEIERKYPNWQIPESENFNKVKDIIKREPMNRIIKNFDTKVWMSGVMREETLERKNVQILEYDEERKIYHFHPIADWSKKEALHYVQVNSLPTNLHHFDIAKGPDQKLECGIHTKK